MKLFSLRIKTFLDLSLNLIDFFSSSSFESKNKLNFFSNSILLLLFFNLYLYLNPRQNEDFPWFLGSLFAFQGIEKKSKNCCFWQRFSIDFSAKQTWDISQDKVCVAHSSFHWFLLYFVLFLVVINIFHPFCHLVKSNWKHKKKYKGTKKFCRKLSWILLARTVLSWTILVLNFHQDLLLKRTENQTFVLTLIIFKSIKILFYNKFSKDFYMASIKMKGLLWTHTNFLVFFLLFFFSLISMNKTRTGSFLCYGKLSTYWKLLLNIRFFNQRCF